MTECVPVLQDPITTSNYTQCKQCKQCNRLNPHHASHWSAETLGRMSVSKGMPVSIVGAERRLSGAVGSEALISISISIQTVIEL